MEHPTDILNDLANKGFMGITIDRGYGSLGNGFVEYAIAIGELATALMAVRSVINVHVITATMTSGSGATASRTGTSQT